MYGAVAFRLGFVGVFPRVGSGVCMDQRDDTLASLGEVNDQLMAKNHALAKALNRATQELARAKAQLNQLAGPPMTFATMVRVYRSICSSKPPMSANCVDYNRVCSMPAPK